MSHSANPKNAQKSRSIKRVSQSITVAIQLLLFLVVIISANYLSCARHTRIDLTKRKEFTLSDLSLKLLKSNDVQNRKTPIKIIAVIRRSSPHYDRMYNLLDEYESKSNGAIQLEFVDPSRQTDRTLEIASTYNRPYTDDMIIIDGRENDKAKPSSPATSPPLKKSSPQKNTTLNKQQKLPAHIRSVQVKDLYIEQLDQFKQLYISAWQDEDILSSLILGAIEGKPRKIYFAIDKSNLESSDGKPPWQALAYILGQQNIQLTPLRLSDIDKIPDDAAGLALIAPQYDLDDRELNLITHYWDKPSSSIFITLDPNVKLNKLKIFLRNYGITPRYDRIITVKHQQTISHVRAIFTRGPEINRDLEGKSTVFDGASSSLEVRENDDQLTNRRIIPLALISAAKGWWGETRYKTPNPVFNKEEDQGENIYLAAAVIRGQATSDATKNLVSKMVVIGNTSFLSQKNTRPEQVDFIKASVNWMIGRPELIGIGPKKIYRNKLTLLEAHHSFINKLLLIFFPAFAVLMSLIIWNMRRS